MCWYNTCWAILGWALDRCCKASPELYHTWQCISGPNMLQDYLQRGRIVRGTPPIAVPVLALPIKSQTSAAAKIQDSILMDGYAEVSLISPTVWYFLFVQSTICGLVHVVKTLESCTANGSAMLVAPGCCMRLKIFTVRIKLHTVKSLDRKHSYCRSHINAVVHIIFTLCF